MTNEISRREFLKELAIAGVGLVTGCGSWVSSEDAKKMAEAASKNAYAQANGEATLRANAEAKLAEAQQVLNYRATVDAKPPVVPTTDETPRPTATTARRTATRPAVTPTTKPAVAPATCKDGELVFVHKAPEGQIFQRTPVGEAERADIVEVSRLGGSGFGGWDRAIFVIPRLGPVWEVNVLNMSTVAERGFCGDNAAVAKWAIDQHVPSLRQASRDPNGNQPNATEIGVYRLDFEGRAMIVEKPANSSAAPKPETVLGWFDVSFHQGSNRSAVPMHVVTK